MPNQVYTEVIERVFNIKDYGASTSNSAAANTAAFDNCIAAIIAAGNGVFYVPSGLYLGQVKIPALSFTTPTVSMLILGEGVPSLCYGTVGTSAMPVTGSIIKSLSSTAGEAVIKIQDSVHPTLGTPFFGSVNVSILNLNIRTYDNPLISGVHAGWAAWFSMEGCQIDTGVYSPQCAQPTHNTACGVIMPYNGNGAMSHLMNNVYCGYSTGIEAYEHTEGYGQKIFACANGINIYTTDQLVKFDNLIICNCTYNIAISGACKLKISSLQIEKTPAGGAAWQQNILDVYDPSNLCEGTITWSITNGGVSGIGATNFTKLSGGTEHGKNIICNPVGGHPQWTTNGRPTTAFAAARGVFGRNTTDSKMEYYNGSAWVQL